MPWSGGHAVEQNGCQTQNWREGKEFASFHIGFLLFGWEPGAGGLVITATGSDKAQGIGERFCGQLVQEGQRAAQEFTPSCALWVKIARCSAMA